MTERERLMELIMNIPPIPVTVGGRSQGKRYMTASHIADRLLSSGVIVPPCKVGDVVYSIEKGIDHQIFIGEVYEITKRREGDLFRFTRKGYFTGVCSFNDFGKTVFLTKEEARKALKERMIQNENQSH